MSRTPNSRKEETHERIVMRRTRDPQARLRRCRRGRLMKEAGLTHGGFYAHFDSREALLVEALERASPELSRTRAPNCEPARASAHSFARPKPISRMIISRPWKPGARSPRSQRHAAPVGDHTKRKPMVAGP